MIPLVARLASIWNQKRVQARVVVEMSIGSSGGVRAAAEGAVDIGMISRPLRDDEKQLGFIVVPVARDVVVVAAHPGIGIDGLTTEELFALYDGRMTQFADGTPVTLLLRDRRESANAALDRMFPKLTAIREAHYSSHRFRVIYHEAAMGVALATTPGGVGVFSLGAIVTDRLSIKALSLDGVTPSPQRVLDGTWRAMRDLRLIVRHERKALASPFIEFVTSKEARAIIESNGYLPPTGGDAP